MAKRSKAVREVTAYIDDMRGKPHGPSQCTVCVHPRRKEIEEAAREFNIQRSRWGETIEDPDTGDQIPQGTNIPWERFVKDFLKPRLGYTGTDKRPLIRHLENHCGIKIS